MFDIKTKILATIGPATKTVASVAGLIDAGVNVFRLNFSHGDFSVHKEFIDLIKQAEKKTGKKVAILQDLSGPKIRTGDFDNDEFVLKKGSKICISPSKVFAKNKDCIFINYKNILQDIKEGHRILLNDGKQALKVIKIHKDYAECLVLAGGKIKSRRGVNLPDSFLSIASFTKKDKKDVQFAVDNDLDFVALSFVQTKKDIQNLKKELKKHNSNAKIIAKIETIPAIENFDEILQEADGVMIARGDLAVEIGAEKVPMIQKGLVKKANNAGKIVIVATQMLETMTDNPVPTRAEVSDIANAILDGADALMLSAETAVGDYPKQTVLVMKNTIKQTEKQMNYYKRLNKPFASAHSNKINELTARHAAKLASELNADAVVVFTETGYTTTAVSKYRIKQPILVFSQSDKTLNQTNLVFGAYPLSKVNLTQKEGVVDIARKFLIGKKILKRGSKIVIVAGLIYGQPGDTNTIITIKL